MYCNKCGAPNPDGSAFCSTCGAKLVAPPRQQSQRWQGPPSRMHAVTIFRESQLFLVNPPINCLIDGNDHRSLENGQSIKIELPAGPHSIELYMGFRHRDLDIDLNSDMTIYVKWNRITGAIVAELRNY